MFPRVMFQRIVITAAAALLPLAASAQSLELTPMFGYRWGGELAANQDGVFDEDFDVDGATTIGLHAGILLGPHSQIELIIDHQSTEFSDETLFAPDPDAVDADITMYHVGYLYQWTPRNLRPYVTGSLGVTSIDPDIPGLQREERFSLSLGGGIKVMASEHVGFRLDTRFYWTDTGSFSDDWDDDCDWRGDCSDWDHELVQSEIKVGVVFLF